MARDNAGKGEFSGEEIIRKNRPGNRGIFLGPLRNAERGHCDRIRRQGAQCLTGIFW